MKSFFKKIFSVVFYCLNLVHPVKKNVIIFSQGKSRYHGNSRVLFEYLADNGFDVFWLYADETQKNKVPKKYDAHLINRKRPKAIGAVMQAKYFVISHGSKDLGNLWHIAKHNTVLNVWHAIGIKTTGLTDVKMSKQASKKLLKNETSYYTYMTASSEIDRNTQCVSLGLDAKRVLATGNPRTDRYLRNREARDTDAARFIKMLYAPTFRDYELDTDLFFPFQDFDSEKLQSFFSQSSNIQIYLRPHPNDRQSIQQAKSLENQFPDNIVYYSQIVCDDIDEQIEQFDVVITDYSSIYIEPLLSDTPCIFIPFDFDLYTKTRGLAYNYDLVTPGPKVTSFREMLNSLEGAIQGASDWSSQRSFVADMFFEYKDPGACQRICEQIFGFKNK